MRIQRILLASCGALAVLAFAATANAQVTGGGKRTLFIAGELHDAGGRLIATSTGVYKQVPQGRK